jgi:hypothetical protein
VSANPKTLQIRSEIEAEVEPAKGASLEQWQPWTVCAVHAAEKADLTLTKRAFDAGNGLWHVRELFGARKAELKKEGKKLKNEMSWTRWYKSEKISTATIRSYICVYGKCIVEPDLLNKPLSYFASVLDVAHESSDEEPIEIGSVRWMQDREKVGADWYLNRGDQVQLESATPDGRHVWQVLTGKHKGKVFNLRPKFLSESPIEVPKAKSDKADPIDRRFTNRTPKKPVEDKAAHEVEPGPIATDEPTERPSFTVVRENKGASPE